MRQSELYRKYVLAVVWVGRVMAVLNLFLPFGTFLAAVTLLLAEAVGLLYRLYEISLAPDEGS